MGVGAVLREARLNRADLSKSYLDGADLPDVDLTNAIFEKSVYRTAVFKNTQCRYVDFSGANLFLTRLHQPIEDYTIWDNANKTLARTLRPGAGGSEKLATEHRNNVLVDCMPTVNLISKGLVSFGDEAGTAGDAVSHLIDGQTEYFVGCETILVDGVKAQRMTSMTGQNCLEMMPNAPGMCLSPSQVTMLALG